MEGSSSSETPRQASFLEVGGGVEGSRGLRLLRIDCGITLRRMTEGMRSDRGPVPSVPLHPRSHSRSASLSCSLHHTNTDKHSLTVIHYHEISQEVELKSC